MNYKKIFLSILALVAFVSVPLAFAEGSASDIPALAGSVTKSFGSIGALMAATAYLAGFALVIAAIFKFKQHKDNPTQIPMGTPVALLILGIALIFLPGFIGPAGQTIFGSNASSVAGGFTGTGATQLPGK